MRNTNPFADSGFNGIIRDLSGGIDVRYYERQSSFERNRAIDSVAKWIGERFARRGHPTREG